MSFDKIEIVTKKTTDLKRKELQEIYYLKNQFWNYGIKSQINWFRINVGKLDLHNMIMLKKKLIAYTLIRKKNYSLKNKKKFLLIDTVVVSRVFHKKGYSNILMNYNNLIIKKLGLNAVLVCKKSLIKFYKNFNWNKTSKSLYNIGNLKKNYIVLKFN